MVYQTVDLSGYDASGGLVLLAEAKNRLATDRRWASQMRGNLVAYGRLPPAAYFLLALPDRFYLWKDPPSDQPYVEPTFEIDPQPLLKPYLDHLGSSVDDLTNEGFELLVAAALNQVLTSADRGEQADEAVRWAKDSGLSEAWRGGRLLLESAQ